MLVLASAICLSLTPSGGRLDTRQRSKSKRFPVDVRVSESVVAVFVLPLLLLRLVERWSS